MYVFEFEILIVYASSTLLRNSGGQSTEKEMKQAVTQVVQELILLFNTSYLDKYWTVSIKPECFPRCV